MKSDGTIKELFFISSMDSIPRFTSSAMSEPSTHTDSSNGPAPLPESSVANEATDSNETGSY
jgi:hypothetical protein